MATKGTTIVLKLRWWVTPYIWLATIAFLPFAPWDEDGGAQDAYMRGHADFVFRHGISVRLC